MSKAEIFIDKDVYEMLMEVQLRPPECDDWTISDSANFEVGLNELLEAVDIYCLENGEWTLQDK